MSSCTHNLSRGSRMLEGWLMVVLQCIHTITVIMTLDHRSTANYRGLWMVRKAQQNALQQSRFTLRMLHGACNNIFTCQIMANILNISQKLAHRKVHAEPCRKMQNASTALADYHRIPQRFSRLLFLQTIKTINPQSVTLAFKKVNYFTLCCIVH